jgi:hypothetical protein
MRQGDNTGSVEVMLRPTSFQCFGVWIPIGLTFIKVYIWPYIGLYSAASPEDSNFNLNKKEMVPSRETKKCLQYFVGNSFR